QGPARRLPKDKSSVDDQGRSGGPAPPGVPSHRGRARVRTATPGGHGMADGATERRKFFVEIIKPSHYDDDGYVIQWVRAFVPSNTLAVLYSLARDSEQRGVLGPDTAIDITVIDEIHTRVKVKQLLARFRCHGGFGLLGLVGVRS